MLSASAGANPSPLGEKVPEGRMRGPFFEYREVAPHQLGRMTYSRATMESRAIWSCHAAVSHGLASSPPRGEGAIAPVRQMEAPSC